MDDWVKNAFQKAQSVEDKREWEQYLERVGKDQTILLFAGFSAGEESMRRLVTLIDTAGLNECFVEFIRGALIASFHEGYQAGKEDC